MIYDSNTFSELVICNNLFKPGSIRKCLYSGQSEIGGKIMVGGMTPDPNFWHEWSSTAFSIGPLQHSPSFLAGECNILNFNLLISESEIICVIRGFHVDGNVSPE